MLAQRLDAQLKQAMAAGGTEPDIVRNYIGGVQSIPQTPTEQVRAGFIHQRPYVFFVQPANIAGRQRCEFGDILYVFKKFDRGGSLVQAKATFVQAKKGLGYWFIEPHQLEFLANINRIQFRFGNSVYKLGGYSPTIYNGLTLQGDIAQYLLLDDVDALSYSVDRIIAHQKLYQHGFSIGGSNPISCRERNAPLCPNHDSHVAFLERFCVGHEGSELAGDFRQVIDLIYKRIGWQLDPPEEFADNFVDDPRGFAIVEITSSAVELQGMQDNYRRL